MNLLNMKLGRIKSPRDARDLKLAKYVKRFPSPPASCDWTIVREPWTMGMNDRIGDCTIVAPANMTIDWSANESNKPLILSDKDILKAYSAISGYNPITGDNDNGATIRDVLKYWQKTGIGGQKIDAYAAVQPLHLLAIQQAVWIFGAVNIGLNMPLAWRNDALKVWDVGQGKQYQPGSWGGHCVPIVGYNAKGVKVVTWTEIKTVTWKAINAFCDEIWAVISKLWVAKDARSPSGFDLATLKADLAQVTQS